MNEFFHTFIPDFDPEPEQLLPISLEQRLIEQRENEQRGGHNGQATKRGVTGEQRVSIYLLIVFIVLCVFFY